MCRETEIVSLLLRATSQVPDPALTYMAASWETAWFPAPIDDIGKLWAQALEGAGITIPCTE